MDKSRDSTKKIKSKMFYSNWFMWRQIFFRNSIEKEKWYIIII